MYGISLHFVSRSESNSNSTNEDCNLLQINYLWDITSSFASNIVLIQI